MAIILSNAQTEALADALRSALDADTDGLGSTITQDDDERAIYIHADNGVYRIDRSGDTTPA